MLAGFQILVREITLSRSPTPTRGRDAPNTPKRQMRALCLLLCGRAASLQLAPGMVRPLVGRRADAAPLMQFNEAAREAMRQEMEEAVAAAQDVAKAQIAAQWEALESALPATQPCDAPILTLCRSAVKMPVFAAACTRAVEAPMAQGDPLGPREAPSLLYPAQGRPRRLLKAALVPAHSHHPTAP